MTRWFWQNGPNLANSNHNNRTSSESERPLSNLGEDEKLKEMIYSIYNYVSAQKDREVGDAPRWNTSSSKWKAQLNLFNYQVTAKVTKTEQ